MNKTDRRTSPRGSTDRRFLDRRTNWAMRFLPLPRALVRGCKPLIARQISTVPVLTRGHECQHRPVPGCEFLHFRAPYMSTPESCSTLVENRYTSPGHQFYTGAVRGPIS